MNELFGILPEEYHDAILRYLKGEDVTLTPEQAFRATDGLTLFTRCVLSAVCRVPRGQTVTYSELARMMGRQSAVRAVASALGRNPLPLVIPCHRVTAACGIGGFAFGLPLKQKLLELEGHVF